MDRSYLFAPGHNRRLLTKVFTTGADAVMLDLEDAVPPDAKPTARAMVAQVLVDHQAWVRVNAARTDWCAADLDAVAERAHGIRIPKVESAADVHWVTERAPGGRSSAPSKAPAACSPPTRSPPSRASSTWPWAASTCNAT